MTASGALGGGGGGATELARECPACLGPLSAWRVVPSSEPAWPGSVALSRCARCGSAVTDGRPPTLDLHESGAYESSAPRLAGAAGPILRHFDRRRLALLAGALPAADRPPRLLDVGAGRGRFVSVARAGGYAAEGIEPTRRGAQAALEHYGVVLQQASVDAAAVESRSLDAITLWHVLEHTDDPLAMLLRIGDWLRPGGVLLIGTPNLASLQAQLGGARWYHLDVPRHRVHFTPAGLYALVHRAGLAPLRTHHVRAEHNAFGMWQSLTGRVTRTPAYLYHLLKRNAPLLSGDLAVTVLALPLAPAAAALELAAGLAGRGGTIAVLARR